MAMPTERTLNPGKIHTAITRALSLFRSISGSLATTALNILSVIVTRIIGRRHRGFPLAVSPLRSQNKAA
jgi:hypothetical protein